MPQGNPKAGFHSEPAAGTGRAGAAGGRTIVGCGSSREHAPWALTQSRFSRRGEHVFRASIFKQNSLKNSLLPIVVPPDAQAELFAAAAENPDAAVKIDLASQTLTTPGGPESGIPHRRLFQALSAGGRGRTRLHSEARGPDRRLRGAPRGVHRHAGVAPPLWGRMASCGGLATRRRQHRRRYHRSYGSGH